jgi:hypothetical protein
MKTAHYLLTTALVAVTLSITFSAEAAEKKVKDASKKMAAPSDESGKWRSVTVECGNGGSVTFLVPVPQRASNGKGSAAQTERATGGRRAQQDVPNGPAAISYAVPEVTAVSSSRSARTCGSASGVQLTDNAALLSSPRYREDHPALQRIPLSSEQSQARADQVKSQLERLMENQAWAESPRAREIFPELQGVQASADETRAKAGRIESQLARLMENQAWVETPRAREEFPELERGLPLAAISQAKARNHQISLGVVTQTSQGN